MNWIDWAIAVGAGLLGFGIVSWLINVVRQQKRPPLAIHLETPDQSENGVARPVAPPVVGSHDSASNDL
jgi:hypothetical protein